MRQLLYAMLFVVGMGQASGAAMIFDNLAASGGPSAIAGVIGPGGPLNFGTELRFTQDTQISSLEVYNAIGTQGQLRFFIYANVPQSAPLYLGDPITFAGDAGLTAADATWKGSGAIDFTFRAGQTYEVGALINVDRLVPYLLGSTTIGAITAAESSPNVLSYTDPLYLGNGNVQIPIRLYGATGSVPEPGSAVMMSLGLMLLGLAYRTILAR